jgi:hypothetical protein
MISRSSSRPAYFHLVSNIHFVITRYQHKPFCLVALILWSAFYLSGTKKVIMNIFLIEIRVGYNI